MRAIIFNDVQNFNGSLDIINSQYAKKDQRFWSYEKYLPFLIRKVNSLKKLENEHLILARAFFYTGRYNAKLLEHLEWSCNHIDRP